MAFDPSGNHLVLANQDSNSVLAFRMDHSTGLPGVVTGRVEVPCPTCITFR